MSLLCTMCRLERHRYSFLLDFQNSLVTLASNRNKALYDVDSYFVSLNSGSVSYTTKSTVFWNNLWYHTKQGRRKGFLSVDLAPMEDQVAASLL